MKTEKTEYTLILTDKLDVVYFGQPVEGPGVEFGATAEDAFVKLRELQEKADVLHYYRVGAEDNNWKVRYWQLQKRSGHGQVIFSADIGKEIPELERVLQEPTGRQKPPCFNMFDLNFAPDECNLPLEYIIPVVTDVFWLQFQRQLEMDKRGMDERGSAARLGAQAVVYRGHSFVKEK